MNSIEVKNLAKYYDGFTLKDVNFVLPYGTIMGLVGENGAGKSTTIKAIMNAIEVDKGDITVLGVSNKSKEFTEIKQDIGIVLDEAYFPEVLNAKNINSIMANTYKNWDKDLYFKYLSRFGLPVDKKFADYSRGMKMKLAIAVAISHKAKLLILDEATSGLDPMIRDEILEVFNEFTRDENCSILISSHIISDLEKICDYITFFHKGNLVLSKGKDEIFESFAIAKLSTEDFCALPQKAIVRKIKTHYGYDVLVKKAEIGEHVKAEHSTLEDIILFMAKGEC